MQLVANFYNSFDSFFEQKKTKLLLKIKKQIEESNFSYNTNNEKIQITISLISKMYEIPEKVLKDRQLAHELKCIDSNYREACGMVFFVLINKLDWKWKDVIEHFNVNKYCIHKYMNYFQDSKKKSTKEKYMYICEKIDNLDF